MTNDDYCPSSKNGKHYYQPIETKSNFELYQFTFPDSVPPIGAVLDVFENLPHLYERVEYTYFYCNCSAVKKVKVDA